MPLNFHNQIVPSCQPEEDIFGISASSTAEVFIKNQKSRCKKSSSTIFYKQIKSSYAKVKKGSSYSSSNNLKGLT